MAAQTVTQTLDTATAQLVYQLSAVVISTVTTVVGFYVKNWLKTNKYVKEYNLYNEATERTLGNAIAYAESAIKKETKQSISKRHLALKYLDEVSPELVAKEGTKLEKMLDRKVQQIAEKRITK